MSKYIIVDGRLYTQDELMHYGVKGMKWGVRRDVQLLANRRFNVKRKQLNTDYKLSKYTKEERNREIKALKNERKKFLSDVKRDYEKLTTEKERYRFNKNIVNMTTKEVPNVKVKRGLSVANRILTGALGGAAVVSGAATAAATVGLVGTGGLAATGFFTGVNAASLVGDHAIRKTILNRTT